MSEHNNIVLNDRNYGLFGSKKRRAITAIIILAFLFIAGYCGWVLYTSSHSYKLHQQINSYNAQILAAKTPALKIPIYNQLIQLCTVAKDASCVQSASQGANKVSPNNPGILIQLGDQAFANGNKTLARTYYMKAQSLINSSPLGPNSSLGTIIKNRLKLVSS